jgi:membrane peptidoglycan carboxypeptidase
MNYDKKFEGPVTLRHALEESRNVPAVRVMEQLGPKQVIAYARRLGLESPLPPYLAVALGAAEATLTEMTSAYSVFPNQGVRLRPYSVLKVTDREGNVLEENRPEPKDAIRADTAFVMTNLLQGVVLRGTAAKAAALNWPLGGKTGTTDDTTDAWFIGFDPDITIGVWVGYDQKDAGADRHGRRGGPPDLDRHHEGVDRRSEGSTEVRGAGEHRLPDRRSPLRASSRRWARPARSAKPSSPARSPGQASADAGLVFVGHCLAQCQPPSASDTS